MSTVVDSTAGPAGQDVVHSVVEKANISINVNLTDIKTFQLVNLSKYYIIVGEAAKKEIVTPVPYPVSFIHASEFSALTKVTLINVGKLDLESFKVNATSAYVFEVPDDSKFGNPNDQIVSYTDWLYHDVHDFIVSLRLTRLVGNQLIYDVDTSKDDVEMSKAKRVDIDQVQNRNISDLLKNIHDDITRDHAYKFCATKFLDAKAARIPAVFLQAGVPDCEENFRTAVLPISQNESDLIRNAERFFAEQYYHPIKALEDIEKILPVTEYISNETSIEVQGMKANVRVPKVMFGRVIYDGMYRWPAVARDMQAALRSATTFSIITENVAVMAQTLSKTIRASSTMDKKGTEYINYLSFYGVPEILRTIYMTYGNPNLFRIKLDVGIVEMTQGDMYVPIVYLLLQVLLVPSTVSITDRRLINNALAHFIVNCKLSASLVAEIGFPETYSQEWKMDNVDYLGRLYTMYHDKLSRSADKIEREVYSFLYEYFNHVTPIQVSEQVEVVCSNGRLDYHPVSCICPYLNGPTKYEYTTLDDNAALREGICGQRIGVIIPTRYSAALEPSVEHIKRRFNALEYLLSGYNRDPIQHPRKEERMNILNVIRQRACAAVTQIYSRYYALAYKYSLSIYSDSVIRQELPLWVLQQSAINRNSLLSLFIDLSVMERVERVDRPTYFEGLSSASVAAVFVYAYKTISRLMYINISDNRVTRLNLSRRRRIELAESVTKDLLGLPSFSVTASLLLHDADRVDFDQIIERMLPLDNLRTVQLVASAHEAMMPIARQIRDRAGIVDRVYVVRRALSCVNPKELSENPIIATTAPYRSALRIKKIVDGIAAFNNYIRVPPTQYTRVRSDPDYIADFYCLDEVNQRRLIEDRNVQIDAIEVRVPCKVKLQFEICNSPCLRPKFTGARYEDLVRTFDGVIAGTTDFDLMEIPICIMLNDISSDLTGSTYKLDSIISAMAGVSDAEVVITREQLESLGMYKCTPVITYLTNLGHEVTYRQMKYEIKHDLNVITRSCNAE